VRRPADEHRQAQRRQPRSQVGVRLRKTRPRLDEPWCALVARGDDGVATGRCLRAEEDVGVVVGEPIAEPSFAGDAAPNRDDRPVVAYTAPRTTYAPQSRPRDRLLDWLAELGVDEVEAATGLDPERLAAYRRARNAFLLAGREVPPIADPVAMLARIGGPMLAVVAASPDFRPAYDPLVALATAAADRAPEQARRVLTELVRLQPARPEAALALRRIDGGETDGPRPGAAH
jgi:hypothetical protein